MSRPVFAKLGGSVLTDKAKEGSFKRAVARRLIGELAKSKLPFVLFHGGGSYGHPPAQRGGIGGGPVNDARRDAVSETLAAMGVLAADVVQLAFKAGLRPMPVPLHVSVSSESGILVGLPVRRLQALLEAGFTPVLHGTVVRDDALGWRVASADELMAELAHDLNPRLALFVTDQDGITDRDGDVVTEVRDVDEVADRGVSGADVTDGLTGKVRRGLAVAEVCPTLIVNGMERGRVLDALKGKPVPCTRLIV